MNNMRMCIICRKRLSKFDLIRFVLVRSRNNVQVKQAATLGGRGYYLCSDVCYQKILAKPYIVHRMFKIPANVDVSWLISEFFANRNAIS